MSRVSRAEVVLGVPPVDDAPVIESVPPAPAPKGKAAKSITESEESSE